METDREELPGYWTLWEVKESDVLITEETLGGGGIGTVVRGLWQGQIDVAVKTVRFVEGYSEKEFNREARIWYNMSSPRVLPLFGIVTKGSDWRFLSPIMENGGAKTYLRQFPPGPQRNEKALSLLRDIAEGMEYLHGRKVVHADLKPEQVLVNKHGRGVVTDFGFSKLDRGNALLSHVPLSTNDTSTRLPALLCGQSDFTVTGARMGTPKYMSPERLLGEGTTTKDDVYAFGITIFALWMLDERLFPELNAGMSLDEQSAFWDQICDGILRPLRQTDPTPEGMPPWLRSLMERCWHQEPSQRPEFSEIKELLVVKVPEPNSPTSPPAFVIDPNLDAAVAVSLAKEAADARDLDKASQLFKMAAEMGHAEAQERLAWYYCNGLGVLERSLAHAVEWYEKAAAQGNGDARIRLAGWYLDGLSVSVNAGKAVELLEQVVAIRSQTLPEDHEDLLAVQQQLARARQSHGHRVQAISLLEHIVAIRDARKRRTIQADWAPSKHSQRELPEDHPNLLSSQHSLASAYRSSGQADKAVALQEHVVAVRERVLAEDHPERLGAQHVLAMAYQEKGETRKAIALLEHVIAIRERAKTQDHPELLGSMHTLAWAHHKNGDLAKAIALLERVVEIQECTLAEDHPNRVGSLNNLALAYYDNGKFGKAVALLEDVVSIQSRTLAEDHPNQVGSQHNLASAYLANGQVGKAVELLEYVFEVRRRTLPEDHTDVLEVQRDLAAAYQFQVQKDVHSSAKEEREIALAADHPADGIHP
ncbi:kinase-like protein [Gonapodya prolifera JEL478]|uniref:Kinase-like protein n=1 Tax=Gonapodya prolifera (strain JEL478) TaxID=1344416 RepID=A0A139AJG8_GONPJ|nr:kinase-like protein [Gonapodya prolifera JEL478]|eukprot:KXS16950.1 kinase-like protein [Gonapodya prolifera JEL478]